MLSRSSSFKNPNFNPKTQGIKYAGSKSKLIPHILKLADKTGAKIVFDGFSGTTRVSQAFAKFGYKVICNDISEWSQVFAQCYLTSQCKKHEFKDLLDHLDNVSFRHGWFTEHYGGEPNKGNSLQKDGLKKPWQVHNTKKLDGILFEIERLSLSSKEKAVVLSSLMLALDKVDNTVGHYVSYLREWSSRSYKQFHLEVPEIFESNYDHEIYKEDIFDICDVDADLAYYDPPYGSNNEKMPPSRVRYASYYHLWTTICLNDEPELFGKSKRRLDTSDTTSSSVFEDFRVNPNTNRFTAVEALEHLIRSTRSQWIILSYSSGGRATAMDISELLCRCGEVVEFLKLDYKRNVMSEMTWTNEWIKQTKEPNLEFLFLLKKTSKSTATRRQQRMKLKSTH